MKIIFKKCAIFFLVFCLLLPILPQPVKAASITVHTATTADDGTEQVGAWNSSYIHTGAALGSHTQSPGWRFTGLNISGTINSAKITVYENNYDACGVTEANIYGWKTSNAGQFSDGVNMPSTVTKTNATANWQFDSCTNLSTSFDTPELKDIIQELVNSYGTQTSINFFAIGVDRGADTNAHFEDYSEDGTNEAILTITYTPTSSDTTPPSTPTNLSATAISSSQINLSWIASIDNVGVSGYKIFREGAQIGTSATNSYSDTGLSASTNYSYTVSAYDAAGNLSSQSSSASAATQSSPPLDTAAPSVPTNLSASAISSSQINLSWTASTDAVGVTGYKVYRGGVQVGTSATNSYSDSGLTPSTAYTYTVSAYDAAGNNSSQSSSSSTTTQTAPPQGTYLWSNILNPSRAIDWAGAGFTIPSYNVNCSIQPTLLTGSGNAATNSSRIQAALNSCDSTHNVVNIPAGTYYVAGWSFGSKSNVVVRGAGSSSTYIYITNTVDCNGFGRGACLGANTGIYWGNSAVNPSGGSHSCSWSAEYAQRTTSITLSNCGSAPPSNTVLFLDQVNDTTDTNGVYICDSYTSGCTDNSPGNYAGRHFSNSPTRSETQAVLATITNAGGGNYTATFSPGIAFNNIRSSQTPGAYWAGYAENVGLENLTYDQGLSGAAISMFNCYHCWVKGIRALYGGRSHIEVHNSLDSVIRDNYFYQTQTPGTSQSYGVEIDYGVSGLLIENNIFQQNTAPVMYGGGTSRNVIGYNFSIDNQGSGYNMQYPFYTHNAGDEFNLWEGNNFDGVNADSTTWGASTNGTFFRNQFIGWQMGKGNYTYPVSIESWSRAFNVIGNILGQPGYHNHYESYATSATGGVNSGDGANTSIFVLGWTGINGWGTCDGINCGPLVRTTLMRWGNYDTATNGTKWDFTEASPAAVPYVNANFSPSYFSSLAHTLSASLYYNSRPFWWPSSKAWPPIGPDVTGGNLGTCSGTYSGAQAVSSSQCTGGTLASAWASHANSIPAQDCYLNVMQGRPDGAGGVLSFDASTCYGGSSTPPPPDTTPPSAPTGVIVQ